MEKKDKGARFSVTDNQDISFTTSASVLVDKETGVNYLIVQRSGDGIAVTPLLGSDGKPVTSASEN